MFNEKDRAVIHYAGQVTRGPATIQEKDLEDLRKHFSEEQIIELTLVACVANFTNRFNDAMQCEPDIGV